MRLAGSGRWALALAIGTSLMLVVMDYIIFVQLAERR
jgi:hypothetical protein